MAKFFYDSYALIAYLDGEQKFKKYFSKEEGITTFFCLMEVYYSLLKRFSKETSEKIIDSFFGLITTPSHEEIKEAVEFRINNKKKQLSYADCLGYIIAKKRNIKFLTGDKEFKELDNVEFVK